MIYKIKVTFTIEPYTIGYVRSGQYSEKVEPQEVGKQTRQLGKHQKTNSKQLKHKLRSENLKFSRPTRRSRSDVNKLFTWPK